ncbi:alpha-ketoglutarate permease [Bacillus thuringiensis]|uniref:Alpha-ketoglutarate permease n=1 Tax=Bacillus thuringiensis TaxID=1428 RepID=A0AAW9GR20_BACTU|nr:alpha-ketoglutarate permease [Bacillus thuringiensis]MDY0853807.1 alpha-ketoglutarate permease [Bacillus thuringiensis]MDY4393771.1 alpha-ketoglutarate permease [Bacillus thuringiensis]
MIKTLLAGTLLSTGLLAGGGIGAEDVKLDQKVDNSKYSDAFKKPEGAKSVKKSEGTGTDSQQGKMVETNGGTESQPGKHAKTVEKSEGTGTDSQEGKMVPTNEEN